MSDTKKYDLAIIGGGPSALAVLSSFLELGDSVKPPKEIIIFESKPMDEIGRGIWAKADAIESQLMLNPGPRTSRLKNGERLGKEFLEKIEFLKNKGVNVTIKAGSEVMTCEREGSTHRITFSNAEGKDIINSRATILATGHFLEESPHMSRPDYTPAYPAKKAMGKMRDTAGNGTTAALGTGPTGVDVAMAWADEFGTFTKGKDGLNFALKDKESTARLVLASPSGMLPKVMEKTANVAASGTHKHLNSERIARLRTQGNGKVALDDVILLAAQDLVAINPDNYLADRIRDSAKKGGDLLGNAIKALIPTEPAHVTLSRDLDVAHGGTGRINNEGPGFGEKLFSFMKPSKAQGSAWQAELSLNPVLSEASQYFSAEDMKRFQELKSVLSSFAAPIPPENAVKMLAMFNAKNAKGEPVLQVAKLASKETPKLDERAGNGYILKTDKGDIHADVLVDGIPGKDITRHPSSLFKQMISEGMIQPGFAKSSDNKTVLRTDGIMVNPQSRDVIPAKPQGQDAPILMTMGNLITNRLLTSMGMLNADAIQIAQELSRRLPPEKETSVAGTKRVATPAASFTEDLSNRGVRPLR